MCHPRPVAAVDPLEVKRVPPGNLRIRRDDFAAVWLTAVELDRANLADGTAWYIGGVAATCQWLSCATYTPPWGRPRPARAPVSGTRRAAFEELIEQEYQAAERLAESRPELVAQRPGWCEAVRATMRWAWRREGPAPLDADGRPTAWSPARSKSCHGADQILPSGPS